MLSPAHAAEEEQAIFPPKNAPFPSDHIILQKVSKMRNADSTSNM
jgi:hypothetical protein